MAIMTPRGSGLEDHGFSPRGRVFWNPTTALLYTHSLLNGEGKLAEGGPIVVDTGRFTGRSPKDKFIVKEPESEDRIGWGAVNQPIEEESFEGLREKVIAYLEEQETIYVTDA
jgi:phosphoenolpyruvate carboxykinase (ATP)